MTRCHEEEMVRTKVSKIELEDVFCSGYRRSERFGGVFTCDLCCAVQ